MVDLSGGRAVSDKISVIVPVYNVENYLRRCVDSIINQTYKNLEIILVDDGSPDNCPVICDEYAQKDSRIKVIHKENGGLSSARNCGMDMATGEYIGFVDGDDWIESDMYKFLIENAEKYNSEISICGSYFNYQDGTQEYRGDNKKKLIIDKTESLQITVGAGFNISVCNKIIKTQFLKSERFDDEFFGVEDWEYNYRILKNSEAVAIICDDIPKYHYFMRENSITHVWNEKKVENSFKLFELFCDQEKDNIKIFPYVCRGYTSHIGPVIKETIITGKTHTKVFKNSVKLLKARENDLLKNTDSFLSKVRLRIMCHCMWVYIFYVKQMKSKYD